VKTGGGQGNSIPAGYGSANYFLSGLPDALYVATTLFAFLTFC
jgi:hypothetical protein